jgi:hypothetical protein
MGFLVRRILAPVLARLGSRTILAVGGTLFVLNMVIPDPIPLIDELLLLAGTIIFSRWAKSGTADPTAPGTTGAPKHVGRGSTHHP